MFSDSFVMVFFGSSKGFFVCLCCCDCHLVFLCFILFSFTFVQGAFSCFSYSCLIVFSCFSFGVLFVVVWLSYGCLMVHLWFPCGCLIDFSSCSFCFSHYFQDLHHPCHQALQSNIHQHDTTWCTRDCEMRVSISHSSSRSESDIARYEIPSRSLGQTHTYGPTSAKSAS